MSASDAKDEVCVTKGEHKRNNSSCSKDNCSKDNCFKIVLVPGEKGNPGPQGSPGPQGPNGTNGVIVNNIQNITVTNTTPITIDPTNNIINVDTSNSPANLVLPGLATSGFISLKLANEWGLPARIQLASGGEIELNSTNPNTTLYWDGTAYHIIDDPANVRALYPNVANPSPAITSSNATAGSGFGNSNNCVALGANGTILVVGSPQYNSSQGGATIFTNIGSGWTQQAFVTDAGSPGGLQGYSVSLSSDGRTLAVGGKGDNGGIGATWIYTFDGTNWNQIVKLIGTNNIGTSFQGTSVALSADGTILSVGAFGDNTSVGAVWVFTSTGGVWTNGGVKITPIGNTGASEIGDSVTISADGSIIAAGGPGNGPFDIGGTWVWVNIGGVWVQQAILVGTGFANVPEQGFSVAMSADGNTIAVGGAFDGGGGESPVPSSRGSVWVFVRTSGVWSQEAGPLFPSDGVPPTLFGFSLALSADGNTLAVGGPIDNSNSGAVWVFRRLNGNWSQYYDKLLNPNITGNSQFGYAVAIASDGHILAASAPDYETNVGTVSVFN